eukprot:scaffold304540_cov40-Tisochrysis_lutea.AAC.2
MVWRCTRRVAQASTPTNGCTRRVAFTLCTTGCTQDTLVAVKVTGDEHVPAGEVTFRADLTALYTEQSSSFEAPDEDLVGVRVEVVSVGSDGTSQPQEVERYKGAGRIAARGFQYAHFVPGQLFLMDTDVIGFLWLQLGTFVVFNRVSDEPPDDADDYGYAAA